MNLRRPLRVLTMQRNFLRITKQLLTRRLVRIRLRRYDQNSLKVKETFGGRKLCLAPRQKFVNYLPRSLIRLCRQFFPGRCRRFVTAE